MCGIAGYVDFSGPAPSPEVLRAMADVMAHRGPDGEGTLVSGPCGLAHRRLSIIDLAGSPQPMQQPDSPVQLTYNGEIYNYRQLRAELLGEGASFETAGDTEVVLRSVQLGWEQAPQRLDGMFAFAAWHRERAALLLARDPIGIKPLFYATPRPDLLVFGSEIKALLRHPEVAPELDRAALRQALRFRAVYGDKTLYRNIRQLAPGAFLTFDRQGLRVGRHYNLAEAARAVRPAAEGWSDEDAVREGRERITAAVRKRLIADVPVGAFLSGGVDSSLIVALMKAARSLDESTHTFSVGFGGDVHSELGYASQVAEALGTKHTEVHLTEGDYMDSFQAMTALRDAPISEPADLAIARMSQVARETVKVVLSGEGSDEVFCGYPKYAFSRAPWLLRAALRGVGPGLTTRIGAALGMEARRVRVAARALAPARELDRLVQWFSYLDRAELESLLPRVGWSDADWAETMESHRNALADFSDRGPAARMQAADCLTWLPGNLLERGDRMTMATGLELRVPFLDRAVAAYGLALPDRMKIRGRAFGPTLKWVVRQWASELLPEQIVKRPKWGFRVPLEAWFRGSMRDMLMDYVGAQNGICGSFGARDQLDGLLAAHHSGERDANLALWTLLSTEVWYQDVFLRHTSPAGART